MKLHRKMLTSPDKFKTVYYRGGTGQPLVFLHGGGVDASCYRKLLELLAEQYMVIAPNLAGHGGSSSPAATWGWDNYAAPVTDLLRHLNVTEAVVVGHSFGGGVAANLAARDQGVSKLILIDTAAAVPLDWSFSSLWRLMILQRLINGKLFSKLSLSFQLISNVMANFVRNGTHALTTQNTMRRLLTSTDDMFGRITIPALILWGKSDEVFPPTAAEQIRSQMSNATVQIIDGDHEWCLYQPAIAADKIATWAK
jgi:pimeloyl-ACP methyl ester carboxylesterase